MENIYFKKISADDTKDLIMNYHYAHRMPSVSYAFGAFKGDDMIGCITYGKPPSPNLCNGICGKEYSKNVYELNRLVIKEKVDNLPSMLISYSIKQLKKHDLILVSFADNHMNHHGYVYQATNWIYTGLSAKRTDTYSPKGVHPRHVPKDVSEKTSHLRILRSRKHRYIYFATNKRKRKEYTSKLKYNIEAYPKGDNLEYSFDKEYNGRWIKNNLTGEVYYEE